MNDEVRIGIDATSPEAAAARELAPRLIAAGKGGDETYSREVTLLVRDILTTQDQVELARRIALMLDALRIYAWVGILTFADRNDLSTEDAMRLKRRA